MVIRVYRCRQCGWEVEVTEHLADPGPTVCGYCGAPSVARVPQLPAAAFVRGAVPGAAGDGRDAVPLRREWVARNPDGTETIYRTLAEAKRGERERCGNAAVAWKNIEYIRKAGYVPQTRRAAFAQGCDDAPGR